MIYKVIANKETICLFTLRLYMYNHVFWHVPIVHHQFDDCSDVSE